MCDVFYVWDLKTLNHGNRVERWLLEAGDAQEGQWGDVGHRVQLPVTDK